MVVAILAARLVSFAALVCGIRRRFSRLLQGRRRGLHFLASYRGLLGNRLALVVSRRGVASDVRVHPLGDRLGLTPASWRTIGQALAVLFVGLGLLNWIFWKLTSIETWLSFKTFAPLPLLAVTLAIVCVTARNTDHVP